MAQRGKLRPRGLKCCPKATQAELMLPFRLTPKALVLWSWVGSCRKTLGVRGQKVYGEQAMVAQEHDWVWGTVGPQCQPEGGPGADCSLEELRSGQSGQSLLPCVAQSVTGDCQRDRRAKADLDRAGLGRLAVSHCQPPPCLAPGPHVFS